MLGWLERSPAYYQMNLHGNKEETESKALERGSLLHLYVEKPEDFVVAEFKKPGEKTAKFIEEIVSLEKASSELEMKVPKEDLYKQAYDKVGFSYSLSKMMEIFREKRQQQYYKYLKTDGNKVVLSSTDHYLITNAINAIRNSKIMREMLFMEEFNPSLIALSEMESYFDYSVYSPYVDELITVPCKARLDKVFIDEQNKKIIIVDLKTTSSNPYGALIRIGKSGKAYLDFKGTGWLQSVLTWGYHRQNFFYLEAARKELEAKFPGFTYEFYFAVVELGNTFDTAVYQLNGILVYEYAKKELEDLLARYHYHQKTGNWRTPIGGDKIILA